MKGKTHLVLGIAAGVTVVLNRETHSLPMMILGTSIGSLMPDIDHPKSKINQKLLTQKNKAYKILFYSLVGIILLYIYTLKNNEIYLLSGLISILIGVSRHRGFTHSILGIFLFMKLGNELINRFGYYDIYLGFLVGYICHLFSDFFTKGGIEVFYPFSENFSFPLNIKAGGIVENTIVFIMGLYSFYVILKYLGLAV
ncbi:metal-dependent hydrolase [Clostridium sp. D2Q-14]|uniref:metal-dependent hydrolase n=1 Tax=Anaeromonas gelatinilytica TaxID=2683194 RepID=UPI00193BF0B7|nr:metal-dependent hydrolase [Anaeromonas gelatinilytica]MBS4534309.1 metal-dependent hydrolase [Anaeromonas gelatinilytica]